VSAINRLAKEKFFFWDYGNAFLLEAQRAGRRRRSAHGARPGLEQTPFLPASH
jgi:hypothetical protein